MSASHSLAIRISFVIVFIAFSIQALPKWYAWLAMLAALLQVLGIRAERRNRSVDSGESRSRGN